MSMVMHSDKVTPGTRRGRKIGHLRGHEAGVRVGYAEGWMRHKWFALATLVTLSVAQPTYAAASAGGWTNGGMVGAGNGALYATVGFPGLSIGYLRGVSDTLDAGGRFIFNYGGEGKPADAWLGIKVAGDAKLKVDPGLPVTLTLRVLPGLGLYFPQGFNIVFLQLPVEVALGIPVSRDVMAHASVEVPLGLGFWNGFGVAIWAAQIPVLIGGGVEIKLDQALSITGQLHMGPHVEIVFGGITSTQFGMDALVGLTYRLPS